MQRMKHIIIQDQVISGKNRLARVEEDTIESAF